MARKWKKLAAIGRKRISFIRINAEGCDSVNLADEGCFVIYSIDRRRFMVPSACLGSRVFQKLLEMSEEEYGLPRDGPIVMPCDSTLLEKVVTLIRQGESKNLEKVLFDAINCNQCSISSSLDESMIHQLAVPVC
ncbi:hypothetical protein BT93_E0559 [Corymbia citriodora subsp. variegata]|nr:hypothetical protein BT93_E0559 [Corymbia citriodora subsp. variegata]